jgi:hypothetical protein
MGFRRELSALLLFGVAFGYVEAAVVVYLRTIDEPARRHARPERSADDVFPLSQLSDWRQSGLEPVCRPLVVTELAREFATLVMLVAVALAHARNVRQWFAGFMIAFGMWDIFYYVFLKVLIGWPASLWTWDILFGLPVAWAGPVITPVLVAAERTLGGSLILWSEAAGAPVRFATGHWAAILGGGLVVVTAFCWDFRNIAAGGMPNPFNWPLFILGNLLGSAGFLHAWTRRKPAPRPAMPTMAASGGRIA